MQLRFPALQTTLSAYNFFSLNKLKSDSFEPLFFFLFSFPPSPPFPFLLPCSPIPLLKIARFRQHGSLAPSRLWLMNGRLALYLGRFAVERFRERLGRATVAEHTEPGFRSSRYADLCAAVAALGQKNHR